MYQLCPYVLVYEMLGATGWREPLSRTEYRKRRCVWYGGRARFKATRRTV